ncbi:MAG TPA: hypothetical protein VGH80_05355 [Xanthomonadaceae bacterium]|jgi:hypothetical protein
MNQSMARPDEPRDRLTPLLAATMLLVIALAYWPLHRAGFVWDDNATFHDNAWLRSGSSWLDLVLHGFADWHSYFRPLGLALFIAEVRGFASTPGPMHAVSLILHLANTALVGWLGLRLLPASASRADARRLVCVAMLVHGLHPALIETTAWISCQFDLVATMFMLAGLSLNLVTRQRAARAMLVAACFFLAACAKESAVAFPVLLALTDWIRPDDEASGESSRRDRLRVLLHRQGPVYLAVLAAGLAYLAFRHWALAQWVQPSSYEPFLTWERFQTVCHTYLVYWRIMVLPFFGLAPEHIVPAASFAATSPASLLADAAACATWVTGLALALRRRRIGVLIAGMTATVFPVLHVIPITFDESLYHERYAANAIAFACALLPGLCAGIATAGRARVDSRFVLAAAAPWILLAAFNVRVTLPLWSNDFSLWQWAARENPDVPGIQDHLLGLYIDRGDWPHARSVAGFLMSSGRDCPSCMLNVANFGLARGDRELASSALQAASAAMGHVVPTPTLIVGYILANGTLRQVEHDDPGAEQAYHDAISIDPRRPEGYMYLALLLARQHRTTEAHATLDKALSLSAPDDAARKRAIFDAVEAKAARSSSP